MCARAEGSWDDVMRLIGQAHVMLHKQGVLRIQTDIRIGSRYDLRSTPRSLPLSVITHPPLRADWWDCDRIDKEQSFDEKVTKVEELLAQDSKS